MLVITVGHFDRKTEMFPVNLAVYVDNEKAIQKAVLETNRTEADLRGDASVRCF